MANETKEKFLKTRIINKHASLADWRNDKAGADKGANFKLKEGEIALARIELTNGTTSGENNNINSTPAYIIKVGAKDANGIEQNFENSAWAYAKAVDVYEWAKAANKPSYSASEIDGLQAFVEGISDIDTDLNTKYSFEIPEDGANKGKLVITPNTWSLGVKGADETPIVLDVVTPAELDVILKGYVKSVDKKDGTAIEVDNADKQNPKVGLKIDATSSNANGGTAVKLSQSNSGLKAEVDLSNFATKAEIPTDFGVLSVTGDQVVVANPTKGDVVLETKLDNSGNVKFSKTANGLKGNVDLSAYQLAADHKDTKTTVSAGSYIDVEITTNNGVFTENSTNNFKVSVKESELIALIGAQTTAAMTFCGATAVLPTTKKVDGKDVALDNGDMFKVTGTITIAAAKDAQGAGFTTKVGDAIVYDGAKWYLIPSGDDIEDTWRPIQVEGSPIGTPAKSSNTVNFIGGDHINVTAVNSSDEDVTDVTISLDHDYIYGHSITEGEGGAIGFDLYRQGDCTSSNDDERIVGMVITAGDEMEVEATETYESLVMGTISHKEIDCTVNSSTSTLEHANTFDVVKSITVNDYGHVTELTTETYTLPALPSPEDIGAATPGDIGNGQFTVSGTGAIELTDGTGIMTANQATGTDTKAVLDVKAKGITTAKLADEAVTTEKIADQAVGAEQTKAYKKADGTSEEVWVFDCGGAE
jgi:hypothetical protein